MEIILVIVAGILAAVVYVLAIWWFFEYIAPFLAILGAAALTGVVLWNYCRALGESLIWGTGFVDSPVPPEPAFKNYFFRKAFYDYRTIARLSYGRNKWDATRLFHWGSIFFKGRWKWFTWPLGVTFYLVLAAAIVIAALPYLFFGTAHLLLVGCFYALAMLVAAILWSLESVILSVRRIFLACPHCYQRFWLPEYHCACGRLHKRLVPGSYGVIRRRCACGAQLPTLFFLGRDRIAAQCPNPTCNHALPARIGSVRSLHVPVIGGPSAGKTSFFTAAMLEFQRLNQKGLTVQFTDESQRKAFERAASNFQAGREPDKTRETSPTAFLTHIRTSGKIRKRERILYVYDPAGEIFQSHSGLGHQDYYSYTHGILFLIDPFSLPAVRLNLARQIQEAATLIRPCEEDPQDVYARVINTLRARSKQGSLASVRFAVVITKIDAFEMEARIRSAKPAGLDGMSPQEVLSRTIRQWLLEQGQGNIVTSVEQSFKTVRYFCCSSLGRMADGSASAFHSTGVLQPLAWVMEGYGVRIP
jgi:Double-GTPase 2